MVIDSSAVVGVLMAEASAAALTDAISRAARVRISAATLVETGIVMVRYRGAPGPDAVDRLLERFSVSVEAVTARQAYIARMAFIRFGRGRHPAALNFGDCFSYALAKQHDEPLLFVGNDFGRTDIRPAAQ